MSDQISGGGFFVTLATFLIAISLSQFPLDSSLQWFRPDFILLVLFFWLIWAPNRVGLVYAFFIGLFQILSLIPGVSRSGISITAARFLKFKRFDAAKISFLLSIPTLGAVSVFGIKNFIISEDVGISMLSLISILFSYIFSLITINYFLKYIERFSLNVFVLYRIILGIILLGLAYL